MTEALIVREAFWCQNCSIAPVETQGAVCLACVAILAEPRRARVVAEARSWIGTPFHDGARIKGVGVDCGQFLGGVFEACGWERMDFGTYKRGFFLHQEVTLYVDELSKRAVRVPLPQAGDIALFKVGRSYGHGAIITEWPVGIHAREGVGVETSDMCQGWLQSRPVIFFDPFTK